MDHHPDRGLDHDNPFVAGEPDNPFVSGSSVSDDLAEAAKVEMPDRVTGRLERAVRAEAAARASHQQLESAKRDYLELAQHSSLGTFGANVPKVYSPVGVGIDHHHPHDEPAGDQPQGS